jgi:hypothetical protein
MLRWMMAPTCAVWMTCLPAINAKTSTGPVKVNKVTNPPMYPVTITPSIMA